MDLCDLYVLFTGEEKQIDFLKKCIEQFYKINNAKIETQKLFMLDFLFSEIRNRIEDLENGNILE
jgi:hypothetical protein